MLDPPGNPQQTANSAANSAANPAAQATWQATWDSPTVHTELLRLSMDRGKFRIARSLRRIRSPRRILATTLAVVFFALYLANGIFILSNRPPADPARLQLWLSGGMVLYGIYHLTRCTWASRIVDLELTDAEQQWLGGAPVCRSSLAIYHLGNVAFASLLKTMMLVVVLAHDVAHIPLLMIGVFVSLLSLEIIRLAIERIVSGLNSRQRRWAKFSAASIAAAVVLQVLANLVAATPLGQPTWVYVISGFRSLGQVASSGSAAGRIEPWYAPSQLAVATESTTTTGVLALLSVLTLPAVVWGLVRIDRWSQRNVVDREKANLQNQSYTTNADLRLQATDAMQSPGRWARMMERAEELCPTYFRPSLAMVTRQWVSVRAYWASIVASLLIPTLLSLSPLVTGQDNSQWLYVVGSVALYTMLLAPPALRIDFRRDLKRSLLIRGLPMTPLQMVIGQTILPSAITIAFQFVTLSIAVVVVQPALGQTILWTGVLAALAVFTFAIENALFLVYPHHEKTQGLGMIIRTKLTFLGKGCVIIVSLLALLAWSLACRSWFPESASQTIFVIGSIIAAWSVAMMSVWSAMQAWQRFDLADDLPPE